MYMSGAKTGMVKFIIPKALKKIPLGLMMARLGFCAAARGSTLPSTAGRLTATGTSPDDRYDVIGFRLVRLPGLSLVSQAGQVKGMRSAESIDTSARRPEGRRPESDVSYRWSTEHPALRQPLLVLLLYGSRYGVSLICANISTAKTARIYFMTGKKH
jgi:hypothetical protein